MDATSISTCHDEDLLAVRCGLGVEDEHDPDPSFRDSRYSRGSGGLSYRPVFGKFYRREFQLLREPLHEVERGVELVIAIVVE